MSRNLHMKKDCEWCATPFKVNPTMLKAGRKCCSAKCSLLKRWSNPEYREKMSLAHKGQIPVNLKQLAEYVRSEESRKRTSLLGKKTGGWNKGKKMPELSGNKNWAWKEDRSTLVKSEKKHLDGQYRDWMRAVKNRDGWKCKITNGDCSGRLEAHHILRWSEHPELRYEINNGITLCAFHHPRKKIDEARLSPFFKELIGG